MMHVQRRIEAQGIVQGAGASVHADSGSGACARAGAGEGC
jgi:hypothetical protein